jgi:DNA-binding PadR family transcriptional regulator
VAHDVNPTAAAILGMLHDGPQSGWDLARRAEATIGAFWRITQSQVYRELAALTDKRLVTTSQPGARERRTYRVTAAGRRAFETWLTRMPGPEQIRMPLLLTMHFGSRLAPDRLAEILASHHAAHQDRLEEYESICAAVADVDPYVLATLEFGLSYERAVLDWFARLADLLPRG